MKLELSDSNFEHEVVNSEIPVIVHFTRENDYDQKLKPVIEELYSIYSDKCKFGRFNISQNNSTGRKYGVFITPVLLIFKSGKAVAHLAGTDISKGAITAELNTVHEKSVEELQELSSTKVKEYKKSLSERLVALDATLGAKSDKLGEAVLSGLIAGVVMAIARNKLGGGIGFLVAAFAYGFLILRVHFTVLERLFATVLMLVIGFYWRESLEWFR
jgi:thioredoxin-like negative regulator of GroEL